MDIQKTDPLHLPRAVFIGGAGQSGTSTLNGLLDRHRDVLACPFETCFIVGPNSLMDVVRAISDEYCAFRLDALLHEFDRLMHHHLASPRSYPYNRFDLASFFGKRRYHSAVERFFARLGVTRFPGDGLLIGPSWRVGRLHAPFKLKALTLPAWLSRERNYLYAAERRPREDALRAARLLLDDLFGAVMRERSARVWCEQTTTNQQFADFLLELYPSALYVNMVRDPFDIALAHASQGWSSDDFSLVCTNIRSRHERWFDVRRRLRPGSFCEVRFEDLLGAPDRELGRVCDAVGIAYDSGMLEGLKRIGHAPGPPEQRAQHAGVDLSTYRRVLGPVAEQLGYSVP